MMKVILIIVGLIVWALAALLIAVSGFIVGSGPQGGNASGIVAAAFWAAVVVCIAAPVAGYMLDRKGKTAGPIIVFMPIIGALIAMALPAPY